VFRYYPPRTNETSSVLLQHQLAPANADILLDSDNEHYIDERHFKSIRLSWPEPNGPAVIVSDDEDDDSDDDLTSGFESDPYWSDFWKPDLFGTRLNSATNGLILVLQKGEDA